jgi:multidrug resistance efflux pump
MAEIKVEAKRSGLGWLWVVIILAVIAAGVWYFMYSSHAMPATAAPADSVRTSLLVPTTTITEGPTNG